MFDNVVATSPRLWKPLDHGAMPYASESGSLLLATGIMASTNTILGLQPVQFNLISDVDISPGAASTVATINAGRYTDNPVLWFHGITHTSELPPWSVRLGYSKNNAASPLNVLG